MKYFLFQISYRIDPFQFSSVWKELAKFDDKHLMMNIYKFTKKNLMVAQIDLINPTTFGHEIDHLLMSDFVNIL